MTAPKWLTYARQFDGLKEYPGAPTNPTIAAWLKKLKAWWAEDATPWCGTFVANAMQATGYPIPKNWFRAKDWAAWGKSCAPCVGAICVKDRKGGGHVFFAVGRGPGVIYGFGGNQGDKVCIAAFPVADIIAFRWPVTEPVGEPLPQMAGGGKAGVSEA